MNPTDPFPRHATFKDRDIPNYYYGIRLKEKLQITFSICRSLWLSIFFSFAAKSQFQPVFNLIQSALNEPHNNFHENAAKHQKLGTNC